MSRLAELGENSEGGLGVEEGDEFIGGAFKRDFVDESCTLGFRLGELAGDIGGGEGDVVDAAGGIFFKKLGDGAVLGGGFEKFEVDISGGKKGGADFLGFDFLASLADKPKDIFVIRDGFFERSNGDAEVVDFGNHRVSGG